MPGKKGNRENGKEGKKQFHALSEVSSITDITPLNPTATCDVGDDARGRIDAPPEFDARTIRDMTRGLLQRLTNFERSVRRLDGSQDAATDYANARLVLVGGVEESVEAIDDAREVGVPFANLARAVDRCRAALDNVRNQPEAVAPLPVDESIVGADDAVLSRPPSNAGNAGSSRPAPPGSFHPSLLPLPSSHGSLREARDEVSRLTRERDAAELRVSELERRSSTGSSVPESLSSDARMYIRQSPQERHVLPPAPTPVRIRSSLMPPPSAAAPRAPARPSPPATETVRTAARPAGLPTCPF